MDILLCVFGLLQDLQLINSPKGLLLDGLPSQQMAELQVYERNEDLSPGAREISRLLG